jgi:tetratricopeptide (TPR) repeat protein
MTQTATERSGLPHAVFLERFSGTASATAPDARLGTGAFLALRLVDCLGPACETVHPEAFSYQHAATERTCRDLPGVHTETAHLVGLVRAAADAFRARDVRIVVPALLAYAHYLEDELRLEEALDVLDTLVRVADAALAPADAIAAQLRIGRVNRKLNRFDEADARYGVAGVLAKASGDVHSAFLSRVGRAIAVQARGNLPEAERALREIAAEARATGEREIEAHAEHALGTTLMLRGKSADAIAHVWCSFQLYEEAASQLRALGDLGSMLLSIGEVAGAEHALLEVVRRGQGAQDVVSNAIVELMHCASHRNDRLGFERWRAACTARAGNMPPNILADFYLKAGIGQARFGRFHEAGRWLDRAHDVAERAGLHELVFRSERLRNGLRDCHAGPSSVLGTAAEPLVEARDSVRAISASLARLEQ